MRKNRQMVVSFIRKEVLDCPAYPAPQGEGSIKLNQNESPWDIPVAVKMKIAERFLNRSWNRYPEAEPTTLRKQLAQYLGVWPDNLVIGNGSNTLVQTLLLAIAMRKKVLVLKPSFSLYYLQSRLFSNELVEVPLTADFTLDLKAVLLAIAKENPQLIFIANPNAPTGSLFQKTDLLEIVKRAPCPVVIDEAYYPFSNVTMIDSIKKFPRLIVLRTFSKAFSMAGIRLGYLVADVELAEQIAKIMVPFSVSSLAQIVAEVVLEDSSWIDGHVKVIRAERDRLYHELGQIAKLRVFPSQANFLLFRVPSAKGVFRKLLEHDVLIRDVSDNDTLADCLRVSVGNEEENAQFLKALHKVLK